MTGLKARRTAAGLTLRQIGETVGVSAQAVAKWEAGTAWPSAGLLPALAGILGCSIDDLYAGDEPGRPDEGIRPYAEEAPETGDDMTDKEDLTC